MPNPYGRAGAPMRELKKDRLRRHIEDLQHAIYVAESRREQAERKLKEIERILSAPNEEGRSQLGHPPLKTYSMVIERAMDAAREEGGAIHSYEIAKRLGEF
jgi:predicted  nucleic acid-binding Zn-ribbon protein